MVTGSDPAVTVEDSVQAALQNPLNLSPTRQAVSARPRRILKASPLPPAPFASLNNLGVEIVSGWSPEFVLFEFRCLVKVRIYSLILKMKK